MDFDKLDNDELLRLALDAINTNRDADAVVMLKTLLERDPHHVFGTYLLAAQHAQLGMMDRAEAGFRAVVQQAPDFPVARFQLGQLLLVKGAAEEARQVFALLTPERNALGAYARALTAAAQEDLPTALAELEAGLALPQEIPALELDMRRLHGQLQSVAAQTAVPMEPAPAPTASSALFLTNYGRDT
jgi:tetratricopeptide (TPR) repeat protein